MNKSKFGVLMLISVLLLSFSTAIVAAQSEYVTEKTTDVDLSSDGTFTATETEIGIAYEIQGVAGATGSVTAQIYAGNPQATASIPEGVTLSRFVVITFNMNAEDFTQAKIYITYTDQEVADLQEPYDLYKYDSATNSYINISSQATIDPDSKLITVTVNSIDDLLFAIGSAAVIVDDTDGVSAAAWATLAVSIIVIVLLVVVGVWYFKKHSS